MVSLMHCNLRRWCFPLHPLAQIYTKLMLRKLALCGGVFWVVAVDAYVYVLAVVVAMGCWCWEIVLVLVKENIS